MINYIKNSYLFIIIFLLVLLKEPIYKIFIIEKNLYNPLKCEFLVSDYNKLLEFNNIDIIYDTSFINSYIIYKDIYDYLNEITIRGGKDYNFSNNAVIYDNTLIGMIDKVNDNSSIVKLITNKNSKISVKINKSVGVLEYKNNNLYVSNIDNYSNIAKGDLIYTSGLGNIHENIYIGKVKEVYLDNLALEKIILVEYEIDIKKIDYVTVIGGIK